MVQTSEVADWRWDQARRFLPFDLDTLALECGALTRRRGVQGGEALVRTLLLCGVPGASLKRASAFAKEAGIASLNATALFKRLARAEALLCTLFRHALSHTLDPAEWLGPYRLLAADATVLCGPGAQGTDQRLHTLYDLGTGQPLFVDLTGPRGGESLRRYAPHLGFGDLVLGDRGYGHGPGLLAALRAGARILVRFEFDSIRLESDFGEKVWSEQACAFLLKEGPVELCVCHPDWPGPLRAIGERNDKGEPVWLLTDLSPEELPKERAREIYMRRWQIELFFKRLKSLLDLDALPTRDGPTARPWIFAKLVLAALAVLLGHERFSPWA